MFILCSFQRAYMKQNKLGLTRHVQSSSRIKLYICTRFQPHLSIPTQQRWFPQVHHPISACRCIPLCKDHLWKSGCSLNNPCSYFWSLHAISHCPGMPSWCEALFQIQLGPWWRWRPCSGQQVILKSSIRIGLLSPSSRPPTFIYCNEVPEQNMQMPMKYTSMLLV